MNGNKIGKHTTVNGAYENHVSHVKTKDQK